MARPIPERDWKFMRKIKDDLIASLCERINKQSIAILNKDHGSEHEKCRQLYKHVRHSDNIIADCFDDWRRSYLMMKLVALQKHDLLTQKHFEQLSEETQQVLKAFRKF